MGFRICFYWLGFKGHYGDPIGKNMESGMEAGFMQGYVEI